MRCWMHGALKRTIFVSLTLAAASCAESSGTGEAVPIPRVVVNCTTSHCRTNATPYIFVIFTTSGCQRLDFGGTISASTASVNCTGSSGCYWEVTSWANGATTIPSGTYSICARIDYDRSYPDAGTNDTIGVLDDVSIGRNTLTQFITTYVDP